MLGACPFYGQMGNGSAHLNLSILPQPKRKKFAKYNLPLPIRLMIPGPAEASCCVGASLVINASLLINLTINPNNYYASIRIIVFCSYQGLVELLNKYLKKEENALIVTIPAWRCKLSKRVSKSSCTRSRVASKRQSNGPNHPERCTFEKIDEILQISIAKRH